MPKGVQRPAVIVGESEGIGDRCTAISYPRFETTPNLPLEEAIMAAIVRSARRAFTETFMYGNTADGPTVYRERRRTDLSARDDNYIKVVLDARWPKGSDRLGDESLQLKRNTVGGSLFRVKILLEQILGEELDVIDIRTGCVTVRFRLPTAMRTLSVKRALERLWAQRDTYSVIDVMGHMDGKSVDYDRHASSAK